MNKIIYILITVILAACGTKKPEQQETKPEQTNSITLTPVQVKNANLTIGTPEMKPMSALLKLNGSIDIPPQNMVSVSFPLGGYLKSSKLLPGLHISKGEVLAVLEDAQFIQLQQDYLMAKSRLVLLESEYKRQLELNQSKASSDKVYQNAKADFDSQKILVKSLSEKLKLIGIDPFSLNEETISRGVNVYSPINGFVSKVNVNIGKYTSPTDVLFELVNPEDIHLNLSVFENDVIKLAVGQRVKAYSHQNPNKFSNAEIILISRNLDANRAAEVHCHFEKYEKELLPGMYMTAEVGIENQTALTVPIESIVKWENKAYVFLDKGSNSFEMKQVMLGLSENNFQEILNPEIAKDKIVTQNAYSLLMQLKNGGE